jgi:hypothetical protein
VSAPIRKLRFVWSLCLIVLFLNYYAATTVFVHTHETRFGLITHSHPYKGAHTHTSNAYELLSILTNSPFLFSSTVFVGAVWFVLRIIRVVYRKQLRHQQKKHIFVRGPPTNV